MNATEKIQVEHDGPVTTITLRRPDKLNALDLEMIEGLAAVCLDIERREQTRVAILTGAGSKAFCAGGDVADWSGYDAAQFGRHWIRRGHAAFNALARLRQPLIAVLNGAVLGGGLELAACADLRIGEEHVRIGQPETGIGIIPGWSGTQRAVRRFGSQPVRRMALFGEVFDAEDSLRLGLIDRIAGTGDGLRMARRMTERLAGRAPFAGELVKLLVNMAEGEERESSAEAMAGMAAAGSPDLDEGIRAFRQKRKPEFPT